MVVRAAGRLHPATVGSLPHTASPGTDLAGRQCGIRWISPRQLSHVSQRQTGRRRRPLLRHSNPQPRRPSVGTMSLALPRDAPERLTLDGIRLTRQVGSMAVQWTTQPAGASVEVAKPQIVPGAVNYFDATLDLGHLTCRLLLKEFPPVLRELGLNELRAYEEMFGPQDGFFTDLLQLAKAELEEGAPSRTPGSLCVPPVYAAFDAYLVQQEGQLPRLQSALPEEDPTAAGQGERSVWLAFRYGEHGTVTLLDYRDQHMLALEEAAREEFLKRTGGTTDDYGKNLRSVLSILMPFERVPEDPAAQWGTYVRTAMYRSLEALAFAHSQGVAHNALSAACLLVNTASHEEAGQLLVKISNFGYSTFPLPGDSGDQSFQDDIANLGLAFTEVLFPRMAQAGTDFRRIIVDVYGCDMAAVAEYVYDEEPWGSALLAEEQGAGWELLRLMLTATRPGQAPQAPMAPLQTAEALLRSRFFTG